MTVATFPASISAIMRLKFGLSKVTPETPSSIKNTGFVKPLSEAYFVKTAFWYELHGDYYLPCLVIPEEENHTIGIWGRKHQQYLKEHRTMIYNDLVLSGKLYSYLADIDTQARNRFDLLVAQMAEKEDINAQLKTHNQMAWVRVMNNIRNRAEEIVLYELIYGEDAV